VIKIGRSELASPSTYGVSGPQPLATPAGSLFAGWRARSAGGTWAALTARDGN